MLNIIKCSKQVEALRVSRVELDVPQEFPGLQRTQDRNSFWDDKVVAKN